MTIYEIFTVLITICALFAYINYKYIKLTATIGIMMLSLSSSVVIVTFGHLFPSFARFITNIVASIDFHKLLMDGMLGLLLFAGAVQLDGKALRKEYMPVIALSTIGTIISTFIIGILLYGLFKIASVNVPYIYCLMFGALISPTDPIAVLSILREAHIPSSLETKITGESLFNDGIGVVIFLTVMETAQSGAANFSVGHTILLFLREAGGGLLYGAMLGYMGYLLLNRINNDQIEVLISLALVMGGYMLAQYLNISGPLAMVVAGLIIGNIGHDKRGEENVLYLNKFWELIDHILNAVLFMLIGFEMLVIDIGAPIILIGVITIAVVLLARYISVWVPVFFLNKFISFENNAVLVLTWGGLRGALSVALALSLPEDMYRSQFVSITYIIVIFSIIVQGLTIGKVARREHLRSKRKQLR